MSTGQIHDLGYKRYAGSRRSLGTRWTVIMRHQLAMSWKTWWRFKVWLIAAVLVTAVASGFLVFASDRLVQGLGAINGVIPKLLDSVLPESVSWYRKIGFFVSLTIGSTVVAGDVQSGAFTFYFARSVRPRDYVIGKIVGLSLLLSLIMLLGPIVLAGLRLGLSGSTTQLIELLPIVYKALAIGLLGTLIYTAVPLGFSALIENRRYAMAIWAAYYLVIGLMAYGIGLKTSPAIGALDLPSALHAVALALFDLQLKTPHTLNIPLDAALISIFGHVAIAIGLMYWRVRSAEQTGVGGAS